MDAKGKLVAHAHDDGVGLVPFILAQMRKGLAMFVG
jgi:mRNA degradation ribonuclease J1/J2